jgi:ribosome recycling factor
MSESQRDKLMRAAQKYGEQLRVHVSRMTEEEQHQWAREVLGDKAYERRVAEARRHLEDGENGPDKRVE